MRTLSRTLRLLGIVVFAVAALHTLMGAQADVLLGAHVSAQTLLDPTADSQNRFFGASFLLYAMLLFACANDLRRHQPLLCYVLLATFLGGCARLLSIWLRGTPSGPALALLAIELIIPPVLWWWVKKVASVEPRQT